MNMNTKSKALSAIWSLKASAI